MIHWKQKLSEKPNGFVSEAEIPNGLDPRTTSFCVGNKAPQPGSLNVQV